MSREKYNGDEKRSSPHNRREGDMTDKTIRFAIWSISTFLLIMIMAGGYSVWVQTQIKESSERQAKNTEDVKNSLHQIVVEMTADRITVRENVKDIEHLDSRVVQNESDIKVLRSNFGNHAINDASYRSVK